MNIMRTVIIISILFLIWMVASLIDVSAHNLSAGTVDSSWNMFKVIWGMDI